MHTPLCTPFLQVLLVILPEQYFKAVEITVCHLFLKDQIHCIKKHAGKVLGHGTNFCTLLSGSAFLLILQIPYHFFF